MKYKIWLLLVVFLGNLFLGKLVYAHNCPLGYTVAWTSFTFNHPSIPFDCVHWVEYCYGVMNRTRRFTSVIVGIITMEENDAKFGRI